MSAALPTPTSLQALARRLQGDVRGGHPATTIARLATLDGAEPGDISFLSAARFREAAAATRASAVLITAELADGLPAGCAALVVADPYAAYARLAQWIAEERLRADAPPPGVDASARVAADARVGDGASVGPGCVIESGALIGERVVLAPGVVIGRRSRIGADTRLMANVCVYDDCTIGERALIHAGTVIGSDGFGFAPHQGRWVKIPQLGRVVIGNDVEIGSNCSIDRGALEDTVIGDGCILDNLIQVAHNVRIGEHSALAGCVGVAGSAVIGKRVRIGGGAGIAGHLAICDDAVISAMTLVGVSIREPGQYTGVFPGMDHAAWKEAAATLRTLPRLRERLRQLERSSGNRR
jgi:UDP-3-O-[3-hydroxymyristoyl] glucosamine N-acyltransferase